MRREDSETADHETEDTTRRKTMRQKTQREGRHIETENTTRRKTTEQKTQRGGKQKTEDTRTEYVQIYLPIFVQGLHSNDQRILSSVLDRADPDLIDNTVSPSITLN